MNRTKISKQYIFSGLVMCGECNSRMVIISGGGKGGYVKYGCRSHRYRGVCANKLTIRQCRLEEELLEALEHQILNNDMIEYAVERFRQELDSRLADIQRGLAPEMLSGLQEKRQNLETQGARLADAIATTGRS